MKIPKCPQCGQVPEVFTTFGVVSETMVVDWNRKDCDCTRTGGDFDPLRTEAMCNCGHRWTLRGVTSIGHMIDRHELTLKE